MATDLDGTLLDSNGTVSPRTRQALRLAEQAGAEVVFVTARPPRGIDGIAEQAGVSGTAVCSNGAIVYDLAAREVRTRITLEADALRKTVALLHEALPGIGIAGETGFNVLAEAAYGRDLWHDRAFLRPVESLCDQEERVVKLMVWSETHPVEHMFTAAVEAVAGHAEVTYSGTIGLLEISAAGVTKATTLAALCAERGIDPADVVAFGDAPNDLAVLAFAGHGYAMGNGHELVLNAVERHTLGNDDDGVAVVLERLFR